MDWLGGQLNRLCEVYCAMGLFNMACYSVPSDICLSISPHLLVSRNLNYSESAIFTHTIKHNYGDIMGAGFDWERGAEPVTESNVKNRSETFVSVLKGLEG